MSSSRPSSRIRNVPLISVTLGFLFTTVCTFALDVLFVRQEGLSAGPAVARALRELPHKQMPLWFCWAFVVLPIVLIYSRKPAAAESAVETGLAAWHRMRLRITLLMAPFLAMSAGIMIYHLAMGQWSMMDWLFAYSFVMLTAVLVTRWVQRPSSEQLHLLATGDDSRINDERAQQVRGRAAYSALSIFIGVLLLGGCVYEAVVLGQWPIRTGAEVLILGMVWAAATSYWNKRL